jgi:hypothetical protein
MSLAVGFLIVVGFPLSLMGALALAIALFRSRAALKRYQHIPDVEAWQHRVEAEVRALYAQAQADAAAMHHQAQADAAAMHHQAQSAAAAVQQHAQSAASALQEHVQAQAAALWTKAQADATTLQRQSETAARRLQKASEAERTKAKAQIADLRAERDEIASEVRQLDHRVEIAEIGLLAPRYDFGEAYEYKVRLDRICEEQTQMVKNGSAARCATQWTVGDSEAKGRKVISKVLRLMLRAFNGESDALIAKVRYDNAASFEAKIERSFESINKLGSGFACEITEGYLRLKLQELRLTHEYQEKLQAEREEQRELREQMRDEEKAQRELEKAEQEAAREEERFARALDKARKEADSAAGAKQQLLLEQIRELEQKVIEAEARRQRAIALAQLTRRGHVYVLSNVGSFGEHVYKIGMTRRQDPQDRVDELGDASVPFSFDIHAMIFTEDAPKLEKALHNLFDNHRLNRVNRRKEFFRVELEQIEQLVRQHHGEFKLTRQAEAIEYRKSLMMGAAPSRQLSAGVPQATSSVSVNS